MSVEIELLFLLGCLHSNPIDDILLGSVLDSDETHSQVDVFTFDHSFGGGTFVHDIDFGDDTNCSNTLWINTSCHLKTIRGGHIDIGWKSTQNNGSGI